MEPIGKYLKAERETRNLSIEEVSKTTKIRIHHLRAIEEDQYEGMPPWAYTKGFLTGYAKHLGLDPVGVLQRYQENLRPVEIPKHEPLKPQAKILSPAKRLRSFSFFGVILTLLLFVLVFMYYDSYEVPAGFSGAILSANVPSNAEPTQLVTPTAVQDEADDPAVQVAMKEKLPLEVTSAALGTGIETEEDRLLLKGSGSAFPCDGEKVYFLTKVQARKDGKISHVWIREDKEVNKVEMDVKQPVWSVYSYLTLQPLLAGNWKVEARDGDSVLSTLNFEATRPSGR